MILNIESLDDPLIADGTTSFAGGQVSNVRANLLQKIEAAQLINCDITRTGELRTRRGTARLGTGTAGSGSILAPHDYVQGLVHYWTATNDYTVAVTGGVAYYWNGTAWAQLGASGYSTVDNRNPVRFAQGIDKLYEADGTMSLFAWDGTTHTNLGGATNAHPPATPYWIIWFTNRLIAVGPTISDALYFSQFLDGATWDRTKWTLRVGGGEGDPVLGFIGWTDFNLVVFKRKSIWTVGCDPMLQVNDPGDTIAAFPVKRITSRFGGIPTTAQQVGGDIFFLATDRTVRSIGRTLAAETQNEASDPISFPVQDILDRINLNQIARSAAGSWNNKYFLSVPIDGSETPNCLLIYDRLLGVWIGTWTGITPTAFAQRNVSGNTRLAIGNANGTVHEWLDYVPENSEVTSTFQDNAVDIPTTLKTRAITFEDPLASKSGFNCEFEFNRSLANVAIEVIRDDGSPESFQSFATVTATITLPVVLPFVLPTAGIKRRAFVLQGFAPFRELQFRLKTTAGKLVLRSINASAFFNTMDTEL